MVIEYLIGGAYRSTYTRKSFRVMYSRFHSPAKVCLLSAIQLLYNDKYIVCCLCYLTLT